MVCANAECVASYSKFHILVKYICSLRATNLKCIKREMATKNRAEIFSYTYKIKKCIEQ